jgi:hypothetical protein
MVFLMNVESVQRDETHWVLHLKKEIFVNLSIIGIGRYLLRHHMKKESVCQRKNISDEQLFANWEPFIAVVNAQLF